MCTKTGADTDEDRNYQIKREWVVMGCDVQATCLNGIQRRMYSAVFFQTATDVPSVSETVLAEDIIASWQSDFGIDVARLFEGVEALELVQDQRAGRLSFYPPIEGDAAFYQALRKFDWYHPPTKEEFAAAAKWLQHGDRVTDIGAGAAGFAAHVPAEDYLVLETDGAAVAAAIANSTLVLNMDMAAYRGAPEFRSAGLVTAFQVLEHVAAPDRFVSEMASLTKPGGHVAIGVPDAGSYVADLPDFMLNAPPHHLTWWTEDALAATMKGAGLSIEAVYRFGVEPWERQLWWMAKLANIARSDGLGRFGAKLRARKVASYLGAWALQIVPIPKAARGSTLLMIGRR